MLGDSLTATMEWKIPDTNNLPDGELAQRFTQLPGALKWHHYFPIYEETFEPFRRQPARILEIGVYKGFSIRMWREYFHPDSIIVGLDVDENCQQFKDETRNLFVRIGHQEDAGFLQSVVDEFGPFDLIIDDGSHVTSHMIDSFNFLFDKGLKDVGMYIVEDTHSNYWKTHRNMRLSFMDLVKHIIDLMHAHYTLGFSEPEFRLGSEKRKTSFKVPRITTMVDEVRFFDSIVIIRKNRHRTVPVSEHR